MLMSEQETSTAAPAQGLRIRTDVKAKASPGPEAAPDIVCRSVNLAYGENQVLHDISM